MIASWGFVFRQEGPAQCWLNSQQAEKTSGGSRDIKAFRVAQACQVVGCYLVRLDCLKAAGILTPGVKVVSGGGDVAAGGLRLIWVRLPKHDHARRIAIRKG